MVRRNGLQPFLLRAQKQGSLPGQSLCRNSEAGGKKADPRSDRPALEHFRNEYSPFEYVECGFFLRKKPLECEVSVYSNSENALAAQVH
jgi:hypothetical protein